MSSWTDMDPFEHGCLGGTVVAVVLLLLWIAWSLDDIAAAYSDRPCPAATEQVEQP